MSFFAKTKPVFQLILVSSFLFIIHQLIFYLSNFQAIETSFEYSLLNLYVVFTSMSLLIVSLLLVINQKNINQVGFTFMFLTCVKMGICYLLLQPILNSSAASKHTEKMNFFILFALFLTLETLFTIRILNSKPN